MKQEQIIEHVLGLIDHLKGRKDTGELTAAEVGIYLKCLAILGAKEAVMSMNQMESLSDKMGVVELPFEVRG